MKTVNPNKRVVIEMVAMIDEPIITKETAEQDAADIENIRQLTPTPEQGKLLAERHPPPREWYKEEWDEPSD